MSRVWAKYLLDAFAWVVAIVFAVVLRYELDLSRIAWAPIALLCLAAVVLQLVVGWLVFLYRGRYPYGSFSEVLALLWVMVAAFVVLGIPIAFYGTSLQIPRSAVLLAIPVALVLMSAVRYFKRLITEQTITPPASAEKALIFGAGYLGDSIIKRMRTDRRSPFIPVGLIDDDPLKRNVSLHGIKVLGTRKDLADLAQRTGATVLVIAVGHADALVFREISDAADLAGLRVKVLPPLTDVQKGQSRLRDLRDISIEDLIGRHPVDTEIESIAGYLRGKRVLVTGAGGSIGSELCRQISKFYPSEMIMVDRDETGLQSTQISISGHGLLDTRDVVLADIRDTAALNEIFRTRRPEVVFHAAALKHLPLLEQYPEEAWKTNVIGSLNVLQASIDNGVDTFVNISTDKAANPTSALGHSKRVAEKLTAWAAETTGNTYVSVRFGNVIGSRGSMLPTFTSLIEAGGPLTVTHPDATRYFMTIPEACQLVIQAGGIGRPAEVLVLDMGEPIRILDVAQRMIEMSGKDIAIVYTGLRPGEKLHEVLVGDNESDHRPIHPKISHTAVKVITPERLNQEEWEARCKSESGEDVAAPSGSKAHG